jgi:hypothetical protein
MPLSEMIMKFFNGFPYLEISHVLSLFDLMWWEPGVAFPTSKVCLNSWTNLKLCRSFCATEVAGQVMPSWLIICDLNSWLIHRINSNCNWIHDLCRSFQQYYMRSH